jgi:hypothetical protein
MNSSKIIISPKTKVGELLDHYPELEKVLIEMSPSFEKLRNPVLRKTVARVATLQQIAAVGNLKVEDIVGRLRLSTGQTEESEANEDAGYLSSEVPEWFRESKILRNFDASPVINSGGSPMNEILSHTNSLQKGEIYELHTPFIPAPIIDILKSKGFYVYCINRDGSTISYFTRAES